MSPLGKKEIYDEIVGKFSPEGLVQNVNVLKIKFGSFTPQFEKIPTSVKYLILDNVKDKGYNIDNFLQRLPNLKILTYIGNPSLRIFTFISELEYLETLSVMSNSLSGLDFSKTISLKSLFVNNKMLSKQQKEQISEIKRKKPAFEMY